jgi:dimethylaniline monooxygenase (N-oxide forming)
VLVVGVGNSGLDISSDLAPHSAIVYLSSRSGTWVAPRTTLFGLPTDHLSTRAAHSIPRFALNYALESLITLHHGDMEKYGLKPKHKFLEATPVVGTNILQLIDSGKVIVKPNVSRFTERGVEFEDGSWQEIDSVVFCTGFKVENPFMDDEIMGKEDEKSDRVRLYKHIFPTTHDHIAFIGLVQPDGSLLPVAELQSRWASLVFSGKYTLPSQKERRDISDMDWLAHRQKYAEKDRFSIAVDQVEYMDSISELMKVKPDLWKLWSSRKTWGLALRVTFGPVISAQYRLEGEGAKRELAEAAIARACEGLDLGYLVRSHNSSKSNK